MDTIEEKAARFIAVKETLLHPEQRQLCGI